MTNLNSKKTITNSLTFEQRELIACMLHSKSYRLTQRRREMLIEHGLWTERGIDTVLHALVAKGLVLWNGYYYLIPILSEDGRRVYYARRDELTVTARMALVEARANRKEEILAKPRGSCERCGKVFYSPVSKVCDNPLCSGWVRHA